MITIVFDGKISVGGFKAAMRIHQETFQAHCLSLNELKACHKIGENLDHIRIDEFEGPQVILAFKKIESLDVVLRQLTELRKKMEGKDEHDQTKEASAKRI